MKLDCYITGRKLVNVLHNTVRFCHMWWTAHGQLSALSLQTITCLRITSEITLTNWKMKSWHSHYTWFFNYYNFSPHAVTCQQLTQFHKKGAYQEAVGEEVNTKMTQNQPRSFSWLGRFYWQGMCSLGLTVRGLCHWVKYANIGYNTLHIHLSLIIHSV